jgi:hypothetical protein
MIINNYIGSMIDCKMHDLLKITLSDFKNKPNLFGLYNHLSAYYPNSTLLKIMHDFEK